MKLKYLNKYGEEQNLNGILESKPIFSNGSNNYGPLDFIRNGKNCLISYTVPRF